MKIRTRFSIITPSYKQLDWLKLCAASVADQRGVDVEHIIQDAGSGQELEVWAGQQPNMKLFVEKDDGMYDAVNRGLRRASGELLAYLNCDEQYLPGAFEQVANYFERNPDVEIVFAHAVVVDADGEFVAYRKAVLPGKYHAWISKNLAILTCATFFRRRMLERNDSLFDQRLKDVGDAEWIIRLINKNVPMGILPIFTSTFTDTGENRNLAPTALREKEEIVASAPAWARALRHPIIMQYRLRRLLAGAYRQEPFDYAIYTSRSPKARTTFHVSHPTWRWR